MEADQTYTWMMIVEMNRYFQIPEMTPMTTINSWLPHNNFNRLLFSNGLSKSTELFETESSEFSFLVFSL